MTTLLRLLLLLACAVPVVSARTFYLSPAGSDSNTGRSAGSPWLSPRHPVRCGDVLVAAPGNYDAAQLQSFGAVTCPTQDRVAWLRCARFAACRVIRSTNGSNINVDHNFWGVDGWYAENTRRDPTWLGSCFNVNAAANFTIHHVIFSNNIAVNCPQTGFGAGYRYGSNPPVSVDYLVLIGNIAYGNGFVHVGGSNLVIFEPMPSDHRPGTHIYFAGNFIFASENPPCDHDPSHQCYDGNGVNIDSPADDQLKVPPYGEQIVVENNISNSNGGVGIRMEYNNVAARPGPFATMIAVGNTAWGNSVGGYQNDPQCGELQGYNTTNTTFRGNLAVSTHEFCYNGHRFVQSPIQISNSDSSNHVTGNWIYTPFGKPEGALYRNSVNTNTSNNSKGEPFSRFDDGNIVGIDPNFAHPFVVPPITASTCEGKGSTVDCMRPVIEGFTPRNPAARAFGYHPPASGPVKNDLFPAWLCHAGVTPGLISMGCAR